MDKEQETPRFVFTGAEFARLFCRGGDHFAAPFASERAEERARKRLRETARTREDCAAGVKLSFEARTPRVCLRLELTGELVEKTAEGYCLSYLSPAGGESPAALAEARLTGALLCRRRNLERLCLCRVSYDPSSGRSGRTYQHHSAAELEEELCRRVQEALDFLALALPSGEPLHFPYDSLREGQRELMEECYSCIKEKRSLFACAPTGVGKTLSFLYPALKAVEKGRARRVLFLTPKGSTQRQIRSAAQALESKGGRCRSVILFARRSRCAHQGPCLRGECSRSAGHEDRLLPALKALFSRYGHFDPENVSGVAEEFRVCPFELSQMAAGFCSLIVGDYNFVFEEKARLRELCDQKGILLVDEAHNLPDRVRESLSFSLDRELCRRVREEFPGAGEELLAQMEGLFAVERANLADGGERMEHQAPEKLKELCSKLCRGLYLHWDPNNTGQSEILYALRGFVKACDGFDGGYVCARGEDGGVKLCLADPSGVIRQWAQAFGIPVYFSATLLPQDYFFSVLGGTPRDRFYQGESPFDPGRLLLCAVPLATALANRGESLKSLCRLVSVACRRPGRYLMFFPSFEYLARVESALKVFCPDLQLLSQRPSMSESARREFLACLDGKIEGNSLLGLCVLGGLFAEGVELKEHSPDGVIVVGTGIAPPSREREAQCAYYARREENGAMFSYVLPGFHKVLQAVGRLIRKETDRGFALLCDRRYADGSYQALYPSHWNEPVVCPDPAHLRELLGRFWEQE